MNVFFRKIAANKMIPGNLYLPWRSCNKLMKFVSYNDIKEECTFCTPSNSVRSFRVYETFESKIPFKFKRNKELLGGDIIAYDSDESMSYRANNKHIYKRFNTSLVLDSEDDVFTRKVYLISSRGREYTMYMEDKEFSIVL